MNSPQFFSIVFSALVLVVLATLWVLAQGQFSKLRRRNAALESELITLRLQSDSAMRSIQQSFDSLHRQFAQLDPRQVAPKALNYTVRGQVMRLHRQGCDSEAIARDLNLPVNEVRMIIKVSRQLLETATAETGSRPRPRVVADAEI